MKEKHGLMDCLGAAERVDKSNHNDPAHMFPGLLSLSQAAMEPWSHLPARSTLPQQAKSEKLSTRMSHSASRTWISDAKRQYETYKRVSGHFRHTAPKSPALPSTFKEWLAHQEAMIEQAKADQQREIQEIQRKIYKLRSGGYKKKKKESKPAFDVTKFDDGRSSVLAMQTIWVSHGIELAKPHAPWPTNDELKHNGIYRASSGQFRALPRPRDADPSVKWNERPLVARFPFDEPSLDEGEDEDEDEDVDNTANITDGEVFLGLELLKELDR
ncbi:uncharacterized protein KD926_010142 [Aspergillus affinis]|uniref:uncharacterized protein n=1 Tax=Aspergillus affinis TaxID=1070780 RepID=UPI0022FDECB5|nr:uncharacterized protein KD926_010142 [Aspergillus affinis]KAI9038928.1 hypothetical protein KD926_010142 [Aspergillus affinis]